MPSHSERYISRCTNCGEIAQKGDKYCRYCGNEVKGSEIEVNLTPFIVTAAYGPPITRKFKCNSCGNSWVSIMIGGEHTRFCPQCGNRIDMAWSKVPNQNRSYEEG